MPRILSKEAEKNWDRVAINYRLPFPLPQEEACVDDKPCTYLILRFTSASVSLLPGPPALSYRHPLTLWTLRSHTVPGIKVIPQMLKSI